MNYYAVQLFVLNIIMANIIKKCSELKFHKERPIKLSVIRWKKGRETQKNILSPGNDTLLCSDLFHDLRLGVGASRVKI